MGTLTTAEKAIMEKYTRIEGKDNILKIVIDHQSFPIIQGMGKPLTQWWREQLAIALARMIEKEG